MCYETKTVNLQNPFSFWTYFDGSERILFYDPIKERLVMGAECLAALHSAEESSNYRFVFSTRYFVDVLKTSRWQGLGNKNIAFRYYLVVENGEQVLYYAGDDIDIPDEETAEVRHAISAASSDFEAWESIFGEAQKRISQTELMKVVLSREVELKSATKISELSIITQLRRNNPGCFVFACSEGDKCFLGATPEILVQKEGALVRTYALAGTIERNEHSDEVQEEKLRNDPKNLHEHKIVLDEIVRRARKLSDTVTVGETKLLQLKNLYHIKTEICALDSTPSLEKWMEVLHPTPAMGGYPTEAALRFLESYEQHDRGLYAAPIGLIESNGDGVYVAGIRSALIVQDVLYAYAGCGIVGQSCCQDEYEEINSKLKTLLESL